jgi:hypothetical protein
MRLDVIFHQQPLSLAAPSSGAPKTSHLSKEPNKSINPDEAAAYGAVVQAAILSGDTFREGGAS